jgi:ATP-dependent helicase/nuclease subunit B
MTPTPRWWMVRCAPPGSGKRSSSNPPWSAGTPRAGGAGSTASRRSSACEFVEERREDPESPRLARLERDLRNLAHLRAFALPIVEHLAAWPASGTWGEWLDRFAALAPAVLRHPERVAPRARRTAADERGRAGVARRSARRHRRSAADDRGGAEAASLRSRVRRQPAPGARADVPRGVRPRAGRADVPAAAARGSDAARPRDARPLDAGLPLQEDRGRAERLLLRLAVGAPTERLWLSYPRIDIGESRPRVPSFYALDVMRAITGRIPNHEELQEEAGRRGGRRARVAGAAGSRRRRSTTSSTTSPCCASCSRRRTRPRCAGTRITCCG